MTSSSTTKRKPQRAAEDSAAFGPIAERFRRAGDLDRAVALCREGLQKFPNIISARVTLGWSLLDQGKYDEARVELEQVLRRAPDNLAAIRGLAELHDRAEHTLNLPMDGPGQWPPSEESLAEAAPEEFDPEIVHEPSVDALNAAAQFAAAEEQTPEFDVKIRPETPAVFTTSSGAALDVKSDDAERVVAEAQVRPEPQPKPATKPVAKTAARREPVVETPVVEEPVVEKPVVQEPVVEEPVVEQAAVEQAVVEEPVIEEPVAEEAAHDAQPEADLVSEADIAALLAEAERLEAEAAASEMPVTEAEADAIGVAGEIDLEATDDVVLAAEAEPVEEAVAEPVEDAIAEPVAEAVAEPVEEAVAEPVAETVAEPVDEPVAEAVAEPVEEAVAEPVAEAVAEPVEEPVAEAVAEPVEEAVAEAVPEPVEEAVAEPVDEIAAQPVEEAIAEPVADPHAEAVAEVAAEPVADVVPEPVAEEVPAPVAARVETETPKRNRFKVVEPLADVRDEFGLSEAVVALAIEQSVAQMHLAEIVPMARAARSDPNATTLQKLEHFLAQVQARRRELMSKSVA